MVEFLQVYIGKTCAQFVGNQSVYIIHPMTQKMLEEKLMKAFQVINFSKYVVLKKALECIEIKFV